jgi:integrase/recombinase XerD
LKKVSIITKQRALRSFFNYLHREKYITKNPVGNLKLLKYRKNAVVTFSKEQQADLFKQPDLRTFTGIRDYTIMSLLLETGIRANECVGISLGGVNLNEYP